MSEIKNKENKCNSQFPQWAKWLAVILIIATFIIACFCLHYLWKLSDIWEAVKASK